MEGAAAVTGMSARGQQLKNEVYNRTGIPVGVGIAPTKTLAQLASYVAKHYPKTGGVVDLVDLCWQ